VIVHPFGSGSGVSVDVDLVEQPSAATSAAHETMRMTNPSS
jgi:hypothetical protein